VGTDFRKRSCAKNVERRRIQLLAAGSACSRRCDPLISARLEQAETMRAVLDIVLLILQIYIWLLIAAAVLSWLIAFNVVNTRNQAVAMVSDFLYRVTEPLLRPIRTMLPNLGGIDVSPVILILLILLLENIIIRYIYPNVF
jgi:YggT family protein